MEKKSRKRNRTHHHTAGLLVLLLFALAFSVGSFLQYRHVSTEESNASISQTDDYSSIADSSDFVVKVYPDGQDTANGSKDVTDGNQAGTDDTLIDFAGQTKDEDAAKDNANAEKDIASGDRLNQAASGDGTNQNGSNAKNGGDSANNAENTSENDEKQSERNGTTSKYAEQQSQEQLIETILKTMTLEEKVAQLFVISPEQLTGASQVTEAGSATEEALKQYPVGGLIYFSQNIVTPDQTKKLLANTRQYAEKDGIAPLLFATDEEGGRVTRIASNKAFAVSNVGSMQALGKTKDQTKAYETGVTLGMYLREYGFNTDFAPDADVITEPENTVIGDRSFGKDPVLVTEMAYQVAKGLMSKNVLSCYKHFPGHGATKADSHKGFAYTDKTLDELKKSELVPFQDAAAREIPMIMASHISLTKALSDGTPVSLSKEAIDGLLREELGFQGVVITDALNMKAVSDLYGSGDACVKAILAGDDLLLYPVDFQAAYQAVLSAAEKGTIAEDRIDQSLRRIFRMKYQIEPEAMEQYREAQKVHSIFSGS